MAPKRTGTLVVRGGIWHARVLVGQGAAKKRQWVSLETDDEALAKRRLGRYVAQIEKDGAPHPETERAIAEDTVRQYALAWYTERKARGVASADDEWRNIKQRALSTIGDMHLTDVRASHIKSIVAATIAEGVSRQTAKHVRGALKRLFDAAWRDELVKENPVAKVEIPKMRETRRERVILADEEFVTLISSPGDIELRMMSLVARVEGGMRTGDLHAWDWSMIDLLDFSECVVPRAKTNEPQSLEVPPVLRPYLKSWWEQHGKVTTGPVFPVRLGKRAGERKSAENSYADRLRRELFRAGVRRHPCARPVYALPAKWGHACCELFATDPLYNDTARTLRVDFHSFRRAFNTALATSGVNVQRAMRLAGHSDTKTHMRYVMAASVELRTIPDAAIPALPANGWDEPPPAPSATPEVAADDKSDGDVSAWGADDQSRLVTDAPLVTVKEANSSVISARSVGLEPTTRGLEGRRFSTTERTSTGKSGPSPSGGDTVGPPGSRWEAADWSPSVTENRPRRERAPGLKVTRRDARDRVAVGLLEAGVVIALQRPDDGPTAVAEMLARVYAGLGGHDADAAVDAVARLGLEEPPARASGGEGGWS